MGWKRRAACLSLIAGLGLLSACGGSGGDSEDSGSAQLRLVNASSAYAGLDLKHGDNSLASGVAYGAASAYASAQAGSSLVALVQSGGNTLSSLYPSLSKDAHYSIISYGWAGAMKSTVLQENEEAPAENYSKLMVLNLAPEAGALDVYLTQNIDELANVSPAMSAVAGGSSSGYYTLTSGSYRLRLSGSGRQGDLRLDIPSITLSSKQVATLVVTPTQGGVLVNGLLLTQQGGLSTYGASKARARVVAALADSAELTATLDSVTLMPRSVAPNIGEYQLVDAGTPTLNLSVNGRTLPVSTPAMSAGNDYTLLVWGEAAAPQLSVLSDDNRLPAAGSAKFRMINGVARLNAGLTLSLDYSAIASNVQPGSVSGSSTVTASTSSLLHVSSPSSGSPVYSVSGLAVQSAGIYTVFMMGGANAMQGTLRRER